MKKSILLAFCFIAMLSFTGCEKEKLNVMPDKKPSVQSERQSKKTVIDERGVKSTIDEDGVAQEKEKEVKEKDESVQEIKEKDREVVKKIIEENADLEAEYLGPSFIKLFSPNDGKIFKKVPIIFEGEVSPNTKKIVVRAWQDKTAEAEGYEDVYTLKNFKAGDEKFTYKASEGWKNLKPGKNSYQFNAYFEGGAVDTTTIVVNYEPEEIAFDGCGKLNKYKNQSWYNDLVGKLAFSKPDEAVQEMCYSENGGLVILIANIDYCYSGELYKYDINKKVLSVAKIENHKDSCSDSLLEFGQRKAKIIEIKSAFGDAGYGFEGYYDYDFEKNVATLKKGYETSHDENGRVQGKWIYY